MAEQHPALRVIIGGTRTGEIRNLRRQLLDQPNLYTDVSQVDGLDVIKVLVNDGLVDKLLFDLHTPILRHRQPLPVSFAISTMAY